MTFFYPDIFGRGSRGAASECHRTTYLWTEKLSVGWKYKQVLQGVLARNLILPDGYEWRKVNEAYVIPPDAPITCSKTLPDFL